MSAIPPIAERGTSPVLSLEGVGFTHRGQALLSDISLTLEPGQGKTLVMGPNGAGKSLLMRLCHGLLIPTSGAICWRGVSGSGALTAPHQAMVFQRPVLLRRTALANLTYVLAVRGTPLRQRKPLAYAVLARFGLSGLALRPARVLSGGEQQRLALARAWLLEPQVLFLDEPTSALDPASTRAVESAVEAFHRAGTHIVMSSHDLHQARRLADQVLFLSNGRLVEQGSAERFFSRPASREAEAYLNGQLLW
ncbi:MULTISPECIES: ATP-binding cassette domain-containing protein [Halomonadaceae]|uniref:ABC transporter ATP-binding protein n=1 Tax=Halomonadaceae TaxID=28256 RepID=UPI00159A11FC|nr:MULTISPECIES: ATP-binding cassette domain-containing protein [Halomonas]QJQ94647.1 ATP-binding cassette domain-containing protein [Halomonas sp. PA5]